MKSEEHYNKVEQSDALLSLKKFTGARIALGRTGVSIPAKEMLQFKMAHAHARDAVYSLLNFDELIDQLQLFNMSIHVLKSKAENKHVYVLRPDLGRKLNEDSVKKLSSSAIATADVCITITDGLSALAINHHAKNILLLLIPMLQQSNIQISSFCLVEQGRVAIADETASLLHAKLSLLLIGERPGLSSFDSLGAYITYQPKPGLTDESRNCVSNIRPQGLNYKEAAGKIFYLIKESLRLKLSGVQLKEKNINQLDL